MPRGYTQLVVYLKNEDEREEIKKIASQLNTSVSELVRAFFRALIQQQTNIQVNTTNTQINIGALQIAIVQQQNTQNNINLVNVKVELREALHWLDIALKGGNPPKIRYQVNEGYKILKKIVSKI